MLFISLISLIIAIALLNVKISPILCTRLASIILIYSAALSLNGLYVQCIGSGIGIYSGLFQVTILSQSIETFIYLIGALILIPWASIDQQNSSSVKLYSSALPRVSEYFLIILFTTLISMYLSIELQSFESLSVFLILVQSIFMDTLWCDSISGGMSVGASISSGQAPLVRLGTAGGAGALGGALHVGFSGVNRLLINTENTSVSPNNSDTPSSSGIDFTHSINEDLLAGLVTDGNPLLMVLSSIHVLNHVNLLFSFLLLITYISKIILSLNYEFMWIEKILPAAYSGKIRLILLNYLKILSSVRDFNFIMLLLVLIVSQTGVLYFFSHVYLNLDAVIEIYTEYKNQN